jgi:hypothetical protein
MDSEETKQSMGSRLISEKPIYCEVPGCRRAVAGGGFETINDLERHKKIVHQTVIGENAYQCASEHCQSKGKIWLELDSFKQHISRMHRDEDEVDLVYRYIFMITALE